MYIRQTIEEVGIGWGTKKLRALLTICLYSYDPFHIAITTPVYQIKSARHSLPRDKKKKKNYNEKFRSFFINREISMIDRDLGDAVNKKIVSELNFRGGNESIFENFFTISFLRYFDISNLGIHKNTDNF